MFFFWFWVFLAQSGPTGLSEWILRAKMEGPNAFQNGAQNTYLFEVAGVPGPVWARETLRVESESQNGAQGVTMGGTIVSNDVHCRFRKRGASLYYRMIVFLYHWVTVLL